VVKDYRGKDANQEVWKFDSALDARLADDLKQAAIEEGSGRRSARSRPPAPPSGRPASIAAGTDWRPRRRRLSGSRRGLAIGGTDEQTPNSAGLTEDVALIVSRYPASKAGKVGAGDNCSHHAQSTWLRTRRDSTPQRQDWKKLLATKPLDASPRIA
jgi:hypothetical protein